MTRFVHSCIKALVLSGICYLPARESKAQQTIVTYNDGNLQALSLGGAFSSNLWSSAYIGFNLKKLGPWNSQWRTFTDGGNNGGCGLIGGIDGSMQFLTIPSTSTPTGQTATAGQTVEDNLMPARVTMRLTKAGQLQIGQTQPDLALHSDYKLAVAGKIVGQSLYITRPASWADYVFAPSYRLRPLPELADYIACNAHLPDVPSTPDVLHNGYDISLMNARLLQKVEELTLYVIELNKKIAALEAATPRK